MTETTRKDVPVTLKDSVPCPHCGNVAVVESMQFVKVDLPGFHGTGYYYCSCTDPSSPNARAVVYKRSEGELVLSFPPGLIETVPS